MKERKRIKGMRASNDNRGSFPLQNGVIKPAGEWKSVKDKLPEIGTPVIAAMRIKGEDREGWKEWWFGCCIYRDFGFPWVQFDNPNPVEYWMELPKPPKAL